MAVDVDFKIDQELLEEMREELRKRKKTRRLSRENRENYERALYARKIRRKLRGVDKIAS
jgi:hypothetical protein